MSSETWNWIPHLVVTLTYLGGCIAALVLFFQRKEKAAVLATLGFGGLFQVHLFASLLMMSPNLAYLLYSLNDILTITNCLNNLIAFGATICLILALWMALRNQSTA